MHDQGRSSPTSDSSGSLSVEAKTDSPIQCEIVPGPDYQPMIKLSKRRWLILLAFVVFGFSSGLVDTLAPILHTMLKLLDLPLNQYVYISQTFGYLPLALAIPTAWFIERYGLRWTMYWAAFLVLIRNSAKSLLFNPDLVGWAQFKMIYWIVSGFSGAQLVSLYYCLPLKISENWFSTSERSVAWTIMIAVSEVGSSVAAVILPRYVTDTKTVKPLFYLNLICAAISALAVFTCITKSKPSHPANERMAKALTIPSIPFFKSYRAMLTHKDTMLHVVYFSLFEAAVISNLTVIQDILTSSGHRETLAGDVQAISAILNIVMLIFFSAFTHRITNTIFVCKLSAVVNVVVFILNFFVIVPPQPDWLVLVTLMFSCIALSWSKPTYNNMTAHLVCGAVLQVTVSGLVTALVIIFMTLHSIMFVSLIEHKDGKSDYTRSAICSSILQLFNTLLYISFFSGQPLISESNQEVDAVTNDRSTSNDASSNSLV